MHLSHAHISWDSDLVMKAIDQCDRYYAETELDKNINQLYPGYELLPEGRSLSHFIGEKKYQKVSRILLKSFGLDLDKYKYLRPLFLQGILDNLIASGGKVAMALDHHLFNYALARGIPTGGVESIHEQMEIIPQLKVEDQCKTLLKIARNTKAYRRRINKLISMYNEKDAAGLYRIGRKQLGKYRNLMLYDRNEKMGLRISQILSEDTAFIAIGAGHLYGATGVLTSLKKQGYRFVSGLDSPE